MQTYVGSYNVNIKVHFILNLCAITFHFSYAEQKLKKETVAKK